MACVAVPIVEGILVKTAEWILVQKERKEEARIKAIKGEVGGKILINGEKSYSFELKNENFPGGEKDLSLKHSGRRGAFRFNKFRYFGGAKSSEEAASLIELFIFRFRSFGF